MGYNEETMKREKEEIRSYVTNNVDDLRRRYGDRYLALTRISGAMIIRADENKFDLVKEINRVNSESTTLIGRIDEILNPREVELPSPERGN